jgi:glucokinase
MQQRRVLANTNGIGIDIGGTSTRIGIFKKIAESHFETVARFPTRQDYAEQIHAIITALDGLGVAEIEGIGVSIGGRMARDGRSVLVAPNLPEYVGKPFAEDIERAYGCPVRLAHDTVCGLLGEVRFGVLQQEERAAYLTLSTGTGAAVYWRKGGNALALSIEIGHQLLDGNELVCLCGQTGCLETYTGGRQLEQRLGAALAVHGQPEVWEALIGKLALGLVNLVHLTRVEVVAMSGAIILNNRAMLVRLQREIDERMRGARVELRLAGLEENAPLIGAMQLLSVGEEMIQH